jgi:CubicO group peptidase (beta-lactamase class C family)
MPGHYCARGKMKRHAVVALFLLISSVCFTQVKPEQIDAIFRPLTDDQSPGLSVGVIHDGKLVFARGYGLANVAQRTPITPDTDFRLASVTKQFTAMSIMLLVHDGKLRYDDTLTKVFPEFPPYGKDITVRQLLNHTSGLKDYGELYVKQVGEQTPMDKVPQILDKGVLQLLEQQTTTDFPPGSKWMYSNSGYAVLAMIVEKASGKPFGDFLHDRIFKPLHMDKTVAFEKGKNEVPNRAFGYRKDKKTGEVAFADQSPTSAVLGDGGIYTSVKEMAKWDKALREHKLLSEAEMREAFTPVQVEGGVKFEDGKELAYGFGWFLNPYKGHEREWHDGGTMGFLTTIQRFPKDGLTVVVLSNRMDLDPGEQALKVADLYLK